MIEARRETTGKVEAVNSLPAVTTIQGDALTRLRELSEQSVNCCVTSPPYFGLRDYGVAGQIGLESTPAEYVANLVAVFREVRRVLHDDGTLWLNLGDSYANDGKWGGHTGGKHVKALHCSLIGRNKRYTGLKPKDLIGIPWSVAFALRDDGWYLRSDIIWAKPNPMPESVMDRPTRSHEYVFLLTKLDRYYYDYEAILEKSVTPENDKSHHSFGVSGGKIDMTPGKNHQESGKKWGKNSRMRIDRDPMHDGRNSKGNGAGRESALYLARNKRDVWTVAASPYTEAHFATFPPNLIKPCILAGCPVGGTVLDPFAGSGTSGLVALELGRSAILVELKPDYIQLIKNRTNVTPSLPM